MEKPELTHLLIISDQHSRANQFLARLRQEGLKLTAMAASNEEEAARQLDVRQWDLVVCCENPALPCDKVLLKLRQSGLDTPLIVIRQDSSSLDVGALFRAGAKDVVDAGDESRLLHAVHREIEAYQHLKQNRELDVGLRELEKRYRLLLDSTEQPIAYILEGMHLYCNGSYARLFGFEDPARVQQTPLLDLLEDSNRATVRRQLGATISRQQTISARVLHKEGPAFDIDMIFNPVLYDGRPCLQLTLRKQAANQDYSRALDKIRHQDLLTRLYNKSYFMEKIESAIGRALQHRQYSCLLLVQVNEFLDIKSTIGISNTNLVLADIAQVLRRSIKKPFAAARLGDYDFGLLLDDYSPAEAVELANFIKGKINNHITSTALPSLQLSCSIGIAAVNGHARDAEDILTKARANLDAPVDKSKSNYEFRIGDSLDHNIGEMLAYLDAALREEKFNLLFQPLVNITGEYSQTYEVLLRMLDSDGNHIRPKAFLPLANLNNRGEDVDRMVLSHVLTLLAEAESPSLRMVVNLTNNSLVSRTFLPWLSEELQRSRISADSLIFQIDEIDICNNLERSVEFCQGLAELNLKTSVYHFGCAINPLEYLASIGPEFVKLDDSLVRDIAYSEQLKNNVRNLIRSLHDRNCKVVVPMVEDANALPLLAELSVDFVQGFYLRPPTPSMDYEFIREEEITVGAPQLQ